MPPLVTLPASPAVHRRDLPVLLAALLAVLGAAVIGTVVSRQLFELALSPPWPSLLAGGAAGIVLSLAAGWAGTRTILRTPPALALREA